MYDRFTDRARIVMTLANQEAQRLNAPLITPLHVLLGLVREGSGIAKQVLVNLKAELTLAEVRGHTPVGPADPIQLMGRLPHAPETNRVVEETINAVKSLSHNHVGTEHLLLGLLAVEGPASDLLRSKGLTACAVEAEVKAIVGSKADGHGPRTSHVDLKAKIRSGILAGIGPGTEFTPPAAPAPPFRFAFTANDSTFEISAPTLEGLRQLGELKWGRGFWDQPAGE